MSFPVKNVIKKEINGSYKLQPQNCLTNPIPPTQITMGEHSHSSVDDIVNLDDAAIASAGLLGGYSSSSVNAGSSDQISLSKKAIHQRDADENLFLRFLELDPPDEDTESPAPTVIAPLNASPIPSAYSQQSRRMSSYAKSAPGRTPFTITKKLTRTLEKGFGFSIVWTHPPRIEKIEHGLSAEKAGILPGDYVIFVDKHNVVTMPEIDILNLIKSQGNTLILEIFRRPSGKQPTNGLIRTNSREAGATKLLNLSNNLNMNMPNLLNNNTSNINNNSHSNELRFDEEALKPLLGGGHQQFVARSSTACSNASIETTKRRLNLPQVTFSKESILQSTPEDPKKKFLYQLINREQHFISALQFGIERFVTPLKDRKDLISPNDHKVLFQNIDELVRISEDIMEQLMQDDTEPQIHFSSRVYLTKCTAICAAYKKYCSGLKKADCVLVNKSRITNCDFMKFITEPPVPRKRPDLTTFIHRPLQHFREILKLVQLLASHCKIDSEEQNNFNSVINELQAAYREITVGGGLMEPLGDGRPLLTLQDLESRLVFTKCKPFVLATPGRQWIFGGDLSRVEGRSVKPYWALLFSDILLFAKVSRDRVLFITEEPMPVNHVVDSTFTIRKRPTEFRITIDPGGRLAESPTTHCSPNLTSTPRKNCRRRTVVLRAPSTELKAVWQNLLTRQILLVNAGLGATPLSSPLESPDIIQTFVPLGNCVTSTPSIGMYNKVLDNNNTRNNHTNHQVRPPFRITSIPFNTSCLHTLTSHKSTNTTTTLVGAAQPKYLKTLSTSIRQFHSSSGISGSISELPELNLNLTNSTKSISQSCNEETENFQNSSLTASNTSVLSEQVRSNCPLGQLPRVRTRSDSSRSSKENVGSGGAGSGGGGRSFIEFSLSSVGRSFFEDQQPHSSGLSPYPESINTPETPPPNISPSSSNRFCEANDNEQVSPTYEKMMEPPESSFGGSWDLIEIDLDFHRVNMDTCFSVDVKEECFFMGDGDVDPFGMLPNKPTAPNLFDL